MGNTFSNIKSALRNSRENPSESALGRCTYKSSNRENEVSKDFGDLTYYDSTVRNDVKSNDKLSSSIWGRIITYTQDVGFNDDDVIPATICSGHNKYETPEKYKECLRKHSAGCHNSFVKYKSKTIQAAAKAKAAFAEWKSLSDPNFIQNLKDNRIRDKITNEKMKLNSILSSSWSDYQNLLKLYTMQNKTLDGKFKYYKYQRDILNNYQKKLEDTISNLNKNKQAENLKYESKVKFQRQLILSRFLIIAVLITLILLVIRKWDTLSI